MSLGRNHGQYWKSDGGPARRRWLCDQEGAAKGIVNTRSTYSLVAWQMLEDFLPSLTAMFRRLIYFV